MRETRFFCCCGFLKLFFYFLFTQSTGSKRLNSMREEVSSNTNTVTDMSNKSPKVGVK